MAIHRTGRIVGGSLATGLAAAVGLIAGPLAYADEHVITGTVLVASAAGWALVAMLSQRWTMQPQRWAWLPAGFLGAAGAALFVFAPGDAALETLGWIWPPLLLAIVAVTIARAGANLQGRSRSWVVYPLLGVYAVCALGGGYEAIRATLDRRAVASTGGLIDVGGHRLHVNCAGSGAPVVVLESGLGETSAYWDLISTAVAADTTVCSYDRAGRGLSEAAADPQDGVAVAKDLHLLLERAHMPGPFVLVGHSSGAQYARIFAGRYPEQAAGMVLLDGQPAEAFEGLPNFPRFYKRFRRVFAVLPSLARLGVGRLFSNDASARHARSLRDEFAELPTSLAQARSFQSLNDRPLIIVTASQDAEVGWLPLQDDMSRLSTNSRHVVVPYTHVEIISSAAAAQTSIAAIRDVVQAVRLGAPLGKS